MPHAQSGSGPCGFFETERISSLKWQRYPCGGLGDSCHHIQFSSEKSSGITSGMQPVPSVQTILKSLPLDQVLDARALTGKVMRDPIPYFLHAYNFI